MRFKILIAFLFVIILIGCSKQDMPYKSLTDTRPSTPTGAAIVKNNVVDNPVETAKSTVQSGPSCRDSEYGKFENAAGFVRGINSDGSEYEISDKCWGDVVFEYFCVDNTAAFEKISCPRGCTNGFCV